MGAPSFTRADGGALSPIELFFATPEVESPRLPPDGRSVVLL